MFAGDILATGFYAASMAEIEKGDTVVVVGAGPVGAFCAAASRRYTDDVLVLDTDPARVAFASDVMGLNAIDVSSEDPQGAVAVATKGEMAAVSMDAVGSIPAFKTAMKCVAEGGRIAVVGVYGPERYELPMGMSWFRGLDIRFAGMANVQAHWREALESTAAGDLDPTAIITHRLPLDDAAEGYELFESRAAMKVVLTP
ncbi:MAG: zinc-binding dehydrogenase [Gammaproteobacteria bacterium]